ncbi:MAG: class I SAM-dependent methyltransferase [Acidimicrobiales bacterium]
MAEAYSATGAAWQVGPGRIYDVLSEHLVAHSPVPLAGRLVVDLGAGTGSATRALQRIGARPLALDAAEGMLRAGPGTRPPSTVADALALPLHTGAVDGVVAAYALNHVADPVEALREVRRVTRPGGPVLVANYATDDGHVAKAAVDRALAEAGHGGTDWYERVRVGTAPLLGTVERAEGALWCAGLSGHAKHDRIPFPALRPSDLVAWRLGMAHVAPFIATLDGARQQRLRERALELLGGDPPMLVRSVITIVAVAG